MRVLKRTSLTQLTEGEKDSDDDDDDDDDNYFYMKPLPEDTPRPKKKTVALPRMGFSFTSSKLKTNYFLKQ